MGVDNGYNNGDVIMDAGDNSNLKPMYYSPVTAKKMHHNALSIAHWDKANAMLEDAENQK